MSLQSDISFHLILSFSDHIHLFRYSQCSLMPRQVSSFVFELLQILCIFSSLTLVASIITYSFDIGTSIIADQLRNLVLIYYFILTLIFISQLLYSNFSYLQVLSTSDYLLQIISLSIYRNQVYTCFLNYQESMENPYQKSLAQYYRQLEAVEKTLSRTPTNNKPKTFLKYKSEHQLKVQKNIDDHQKLSKYKKTQKLSLTKKKTIQQPTNEQSYEGLPIKYLTDLKESQISKNGMYNSTATKQQNQKIILQIHQPYVYASQLNSSISSNLKINCRDDGQDFVGKNLDLFRKDQEDLQGDLEGGSHVGVDGLMGELVRRNRVYESVLRHCKDEHADKAIAFEKMWKKYQLYKKFITKLNSLSSRSTK